LPAPTADGAQGVELIADPIHGYVPFTVPLERSGRPEEVTEKDLLDTPWMQRLRAIMQLQSARWVFPAAEHSRFQHSLGTMHVAGRFAQQLYPSLRQVEPGCPSLPFVESLLRVSGLLHDVGHGPFCHFFDDNHLTQYGIGHEVVGHRIITQELSDMIRHMRRSPSGDFADSEVLEPEFIAFLMQKKAVGGDHMPVWLQLLKPVLSGMYTADNLDYVLRDAYMCGVAVGPVDLGRLLHYSFLTAQGLTLHTAGIGALTMFLTARLYLYTHIYFHRTTRAIDLHLREIFQDTMRSLCPGNPLDHLDHYLGLTDWSVLEAVRVWESDPQPGKRALGREWAAILRRQVKWKMAYDATLSVREWERRTGERCDPQQLMTCIRQALPPTLRDLECQIDVATQDPRNINPLAMEEWPIVIYDPSTGKVRAELLETMLEFIPAEMTQYRLYMTDVAYKPVVARACEAALSGTECGFKGNAR
jgi:HD superfamily phosphohydrolase